MLTAVAGFAALFYGLFGPDLGTTQILVWMGLGALLVFMGVALFSSRLVRPLAGVLGWPATRIGGTAGSLARDNSQRNPQRTASTASALMIGLALVTLVATLAAGIVNSFEGAVNDLFTGDYAITAQNNFSPIPIAAADAAAESPGVTAVGNVRTGEARIFEQDGVRDGSRPGDARGHLDGLGRRLAGGLHDAGRRRRDHRRRLRRRSRPPARLPRARDVPERRGQDLPHPRDLRPSERRLAVRA